MRVIRCEAGHYYNLDRYDVCPSCQRRELEREEESTGNDGELNRCRHGHYYLSGGYRTCPDCGIDLGPGEQTPSETPSKAVGSKAPVTEDRPPIDLPSWVEPAVVPSWPVREWADSQLHYALAVNARWDSVPTSKTLQYETDHVFRGNSREECLTVGFMPNADAASDITNWVGVITALLGFPIPELMEDGEDQPELVGWREVPAYGLCEHYRVDECRAYEGLALFKKDYPTLARLYVLLVRRGHYAWKVTLSFMTACLPGMPNYEAMVDTDDHSRAAATFGALRFDGGNEAEE